MRTLQNHGPITETGSQDCPALVREDSLNSIESHSKCKDDDDWFFEWIRRQVL